MASTRERDEIRNILYDYLTYYVRVEERQSLNKNNNNKKKTKNKKTERKLYTVKKHTHIVLKRERWRVVNLMKCGARTRKINYQVVYNRTFLGMTERCEHAEHKNTEYRGQKKSMKYQVSEETDGSTDTGE